ncbi:MAG: tetratricopeptide repeat protein [Cyanobacteria bacterium]|nr:tetratricopeptide repeat protein [Cyanobacteriota bacterium]
MKYFKQPTILLIAFSLSLFLADKAHATSPIIESIQGKGDVYRKNQKKGIPLKAGLEIFQGDQLFVRESARAKVSCPKNNGQVTSERVPTGVWIGIQKICIKWISPDVRPGADSSIVGGTDNSIPYLISPRHSLLINENPSFRWNSVSGAKHYNLSVMMNRQVIWSTTTVGTEIQYQGPMLQAGLSYSVVVRSDNGTSSSEDLSPLTSKPSENLDFRILRKEEANGIRQENLSSIDAVVRQVKSYRNYRVPAAMKDFYGLTSYNYGDYGLLAEAAVILENYLRNDPKSSLIRLTLADVYSESGLTKLAEENYLSVIRDSSHENDIEERTKAHIALGAIYERYLKNKCKAIFHYEQAAIDFKDLEDLSLADNYQNAADRQKKWLRPGVCSPDK